jgi:chorismate mutase
MLMDATKMIQIGALKMCLRMAQNYYLNQPKHQISHGIYLTIDRMHSDVFNATNNGRKIKY